MTLENRAACAGTRTAAIFRLVRTLPLAISASVLLAVSTLASAGLPAFDRVRVLDTPRPIDNARLTDHNDRAFELQALHGKVAFVLFGYTNCPDVCPLAMERLRELHDSGALKGAGVAYVMISVDGERDTPAAMKAFLAKYSADFLGLTAAPSVVKPVATQFSATFFKGGHKGHGDGYDVGHSPQIFVLDRDGHLRAEVYNASIETMAALAHALLTEGQ